jgi:hypothetical protein
MEPLDMRDDRNNIYKVDTVLSLLVFRLDKTRKVHYAATKAYVPPNRNILHLIKTSRQVSNMNYTGKMFRHVSWCNANNRLVLLLLLRQNRIFKSLNLSTSTYPPTISLTPSTPVLILSLPVQGH